MALTNITHSLIQITKQKCFITVIFCLCQLFFQLKVSDHACVLGVSNWYFSMIVRFDFETVPKEWYFLFFIFLLVNNLELLFPRTINFQLYIPYKSMTRNIKLV
jgi:hypothetical protein